MALYKSVTLVTHTNDAAFDAVYTPGTLTPHSGIYRCLACGDEIASNAGNPLPPQNHRQHHPNQGAVRWQLLVYAQQQP